MYPNPFRPLSTRTTSGESVAVNNVLNVSASTTAASGNFGGVTGQDGNTDVRVANQTSGWAYVTIGDGSQPTATANNGIAFAPGSVEVISIPATAQQVSVILSTGTGTVQFVRGIGL